MSKVKKHKVDWTIPFVRNPLRQTYRVWEGMLYRCTNENSSRYADYGGRGIKVCDRWAESFDNFVDDVGIRPAGLTLERLDVNGNYEPANVKWATYLEQANNRRIKKYAGLHFFKRRNMWQVSISVFGKNVHLGYAKKKEDALKLRKAGQAVKDAMIKFGVYKNENIDV